MRRIMKGSIIILLTIGLIISIQGTTLAKAKKIEVYGLDDLLTLIWQKVTPLGESGRLLIEGQKPRQL